LLLRLLGLSRLVDLLRLLGRRSLLLGLFNELRALLEEGGGGRAHGEGVPVGREREHQRELVLARELVGRARAAERRTIAPRREIHRELVRQFARALAEAEDEGSVVVLRELRQLALFDELARVEQRLRRRGHLGD